MWLREGLKLSTCRFNFPRFLPNRALGAGLTPSCISQWFMHTKGLFGIWYKQSTYNGAIGKRDKKMVLKHRRQASLGEPDPF